MIRCMAAAFLLFLIASPLSADAELPITVERLSDRVIVLSEDTLVSNVVAVAAKKGIVVMDTSGSPLTAKRIRKLIEKEFKRSDFAYVINMHGHWKHAFGNQVFSDAVIIGHKACEADMRSDAQRLPLYVESMRRSPEARKEGSPLKRILDDVSENLVLTPPDLTFADRMTLDLGDLTVRLIFFGRSHTESDIFVQVPEEGLLHVGDAFLDQAWLPIFHHQPTLDVPRWLEVLERVIAEKPKHVLLAHLGPSSLERLVLWRDYIRDLWDGVQAARKEGLDLEGVQKRLPLDERILYLEEMGHARQAIMNFHDTCVRGFWRQQLESAALIVERTLEKEGVEAALAKYRELKGGDGKKFFFEEFQFNDLGYRFMGQGKMEEAVAIFKMNVESFPASWNVYDSLAEAYMNCGKKEMAAEYYKKSLARNPANANAKAFLKKLAKD